MPLEKPPFRSPCNNCGRCCEEELCDVGEIMFPGSSAPCPGLMPSDGKKLCGLVLLERAIKMPPLIQRGLGIGCGCSMPDPDTTDLELEEFDLISIIAVQKLHPIN